jgi:two-component system alkaline phosphatase synthesis response regulator PhoP
MKRVLIIEDDPQIVELLDIHLTDLGCHTRKAGNGREGLELALKENFDLLILDLMLPGINGMDVCRRIRQAGNATPIMILSARSEEADKVLGWGQAPKTI